MQPTGHRLYGDLAWLWPIVSPPAHCREESQQFVALLRQHGPAQMRRLLHLGCGGGHNDSAFKREFLVTGVDISEEMLAHARVLNPEATYQRGDMRTARLGETFSAVVALDAINYMLSEKDLRAVFETAWAHLGPGGVFLTYVEQSLGRFQQNRTMASIESAGDVEVTFVENCYDADSTDTTYESTFLYLIRRGGKLTIETDVGLNGIFPLGTWIREMLDVGFDVREHEYRTDSGSLPVLVGVRRP